MNSTDGGTGATESDEGGYVHDPAAFDEDGERIDGDRDDAEDRDDAGDRDDAAIARAIDETATDADDREFGRQGWVLLGVMLVAFVIAPVVVYLRPPALPWWVALVVMPLIPAIVLGVTAVWATTQA